jgi:hypothetical protein
MLTMDINEVLRQLLQNPDALKSQLASAAVAYANLLFTQDGLNGQFKQKRELMDALESYLMANRGSDPFPTFLTSVAQFVQETLAYALADGLQKAQLVQVLQDLAQHIESRQPDTEIQAAYGKTLLGLEAVQRVRDWVQSNQIVLLQQELSDETLLAIVWPLIMEILGDAKVGKYLPATQMLPNALRWISGANFAQMLSDWQANGGVIRHGKKTRTATLDDIVNFCENVIGYDSTLIIAAINEMLGNVAGFEAAAGTQAALSHLLKRLKYGVSHPDEIALYELGFADRMAANRIRVLISDDTESPIRVRLRENEQMGNVLASLPRYFRECYDSVV